MSSVNNSKSSKSNFKNVREIKISVNSTHNNTIITATDLLGNTILSRSCGQMNFRGTLKNTSHAAEVCANEVVRVLNKNFLSIKEVFLRIKGIGLGRDPACKVIVSKMAVAANRIQDVTRAPHGGCTPPKRRRV